MDVSQHTRKLYVDICSGNTICKNEENDLYSICVPLDGGARLVVRRLMDAVDAPGPPACSAKHALAGKGEHAAGNIDKPCRNIPTIQPQALFWRG